MNEIKTPIKILIVIDMQNDFITGCLGSPAARAIVPKVVDYVKKCSDEGYKIFFTRDTHTASNYFDSLEGTSSIPMHCINKTNGWNIIPELSPFVIEPDSHGNGGNTVNKFGFGCTSWYELLDKYKYELSQSLGKSAYDFTDRDLQIEIVGVCTDICVLANAVILRANNRDATIIVHADMCAGTSVERHENALTAMQSQLITIDRGE